VAAAAEPLAAALQFHHRALLIGYDTAGVGIIQTLVPLHGGMAMELTTGRMLTAGMTPLQDKGVSPDLCLAAK
jgi:carboxyl-terminal processing protease